MNGEYVYCRPKKKWRKMGLLSMSLQKVIMFPFKRGRFYVVDHRDGNPLKNEKCNLRVCTHPENMRNRKPTVGGTSVYKGVDWYKPTSKWRTQICYETERKTIGYFSDEVAAANCYNYYAIEYFGEFALLNDVTYMPKEEWEKFRFGSDKTSKFRGVSFVKQKWLAQIYHGGKNIRISSHESEMDAAIAYNLKAIELKGDKAKLNKLEMVKLCQIQIQQKLR